MPQQAERLKRVMLPLIKAMDHPLPTNQVKIGIMDDSHINAASAGGGEFYVTRGLLEKANDQQLAGVLAHELAHDDLRHVAKAQALGTGLSIGMVILDQIVPGSGALTPIAGQLLMNRYSSEGRVRRGPSRHGDSAEGRDVARHHAGDPDVAHADRRRQQGGFFATHPATQDRIEALRRAK